MISWFVLCSCVYVIFIVCDWILLSEIEFGLIGINVLDDVENYDVMVGVFIFFEG